MSPRFEPFRHARAGRSAFGAGGPPLSPPLHSDVAVGRKRQCRRVCIRHCRRTTSHPVAAGCDSGGEPRSRDAQQKCSRAIRLKPGCEAQLHIYDWVPMTLLFVLGVMNLLWIAALAGFVLLEKVALAGHWVSRLTGVLLAGWGAWMMRSGLG